MFVQFNLEGLDEYIRLQGWEYSMDSQLPVTMRGYAWSGQEWPFLDIIDSADTDQINHSNRPPVLRDESGGS
jgi:hypothetical protein